MRKFTAALLLITMLLTLASPAWAASGEALYAQVAPNGLIELRGTLYIADGASHTILTVDGPVPTVAAGQAGVTGYHDDVAQHALFSEPWGMAPYRDGLLVADRANHVVRYVDLKNDRVYTAIGTGKAGFADGLGRAAALSEPTGLAADDQGRIYIADTGNDAIRVMDKDGNVTTLLSTGLSSPTGLAFSGGVLYIADTGSHRILAVENGVLRTVAGATLTGDAAIEGDYRNGPAASACFSSPQGVAVGADGSIYVADTGNGAVRCIRNGAVSTLLRADDETLWPVAPAAVLADAEGALVGDSFAQVILRVSGTAQTAFSDVPADAWFVDAVDFAVARGLMNGTSADGFSPNASMTRGMVLTVLAREAGVDTAGTPWYAASVAWAKAAGVSDGSAPEASITREQLAAILHRHAGSPAGEGSLDGFADASQVSPYAVDALRWAVAEGILTGLPDGRLDPAGTATRAQVAVMLERYLG